MGSSHCWMRVTAGSAARSGEGSRTHQVAVLTTIHRTPASIAWAIPLSTSPAALAPDLITLPAAQAGLVNGLQCMGYPWFAKAV